MAYNNINWQNNSTPLNADNMNNIMEGISLALGYTDRSKIPGIGSEGITKPTMFRLGIANYSIIGNDVENNKSYGNCATALGTNTVAGSNAFKITNIANKVITLTSVIGIKEVLNAESTIQYSCQLTENYDLYGNITDVDETNKTITVDTIPNSTTTTGILWIPSHPELGDGETIVGTGAFAAGYDSKASQVASFTTGYNNIAAGKYSAVFGNSNIAGYASVVGGQYNTANQWSAAFGYKNTINGANSFGTGYNNIVNGNYSGTIGKGNNITGEASFIAGQSSTIDSVNSLSSGVNNIIEATAKESLAVGSNNIIKAPHSAAIGFKHIINASANGRAFAAGSGNTVSHNFSAAIGHALTTSRDSQIVVGRQNINDSTAMFIVGNGTAADKLNNAFVVKETGDAVVSGALKAKTATISGDLYANAYTGTSGKVVINSSTNTATGDSSFSGGNASQALGRFSFAFGNGSIAGTTNDNGKYAVAIGFGAKATHDGAVAIGWGIKAPYKYSTALGINTETAAEKQLVCGTWNTLDTNSAFIIGNGTSDSARSYAFNVRKNGQALLGSADILNDDKAVTTKKYVDNKVVSQSNVSQSYDPTSSQAMSGNAIDKIIDSEELSSTNIGSMIGNQLIVKQQVNRNETDPTFDNYNYQWQYNIVPFTTPFSDLYGKYVNKIKLSINHEGDINFDNGGNWDAMLGSISNIIDGCTIIIDDKYINSRIISNISNIKYNPLNFGFTLEILCEPFILNENTTISINVYSSRTTTNDDYGYDDLTYQFDYSDFVVELTSTNITDISLPINTLIFNDSNDAPELNGEWEPVNSLIESGYVFRKVSNITGNIYNDIMS